MSDALGYRATLQMLGNPRLVETVEYIPATGSENDRGTGINVRVRREPPELEGDDRATTKVYRATIRVLASVHATHKGIVSPEVGDRWKLAINRGGTAVEPWKAGVAQGADGSWLIPVQYSPRKEAGGKRVRIGE